MLHGVVVGVEGGKLPVPSLGVVEGLPELLADRVLQRQLLAVQLLVALPRLLHPNLWPRSTLLQLSHRLLHLLRDAPSLYLALRCHTLLR